MKAVLQALAERLDVAPTDKLAIAALADYLEEQGASTEPLRVLTTLEDGPTVLVFGFPAHFSAAAVNSLRDAARMIADTLGRNGKPVVWAVVPDSVTIRQIRERTP